jgi:hypothetical protein
MKMTQEQLRQEFIESKDILLQFLRHPLTQMKHLPDWTWKRLLLVLLVISSGTGVLAGFLEKKIILSIIAGLILTPILTLIQITVACVFFYYLFQIFADRTVPFRQLFTVVFFAFIPQLVLNILAGYIPPISLIGMAFTAMLLSVGFVENFQLPRRLVLRLIAILYVIFFVLWIWSRISSSKLETTWHEDNRAPEVHLGE